MVVAAGIGGRAAQQRTAGPGPATIVELDLVVLDEQGRPVQGLRRDDFRIKEDGKAVAIESFTEHTALGAFGRSDARSVVLLLDDTGVPPELTTRVQTIARQFIDRMGADDRVSVVRFNKRGDEIVGDRSIALSRIANYYGGMVPHFGRETFENALTRVTQISRQLEPEQHRRKAIVCIGAPEVFDVNEPTQGRASLIWPYWIGAIEAASRANVAVYVIDPAGTTGRVKIRGSGSLTAQTGGESFVNSNAFDTAVARIWDEASHYYLIEYAPSRSGDDLHEIEVKAAAPGVRVRARRNRG
jgi:VWFA-related protein